MESFPPEHAEVCSELREIWTEIPSDLQQGMPCEIIAQLAKLILDGTTLQVVSTLSEIQKLKEVELSQHRKLLVTQLKKKMSDLEAIYESRRKVIVLAGGPLEELEKELALDMNELKQSCQKELNQKDMKIIREIDQVVSEQQVALEKIGVPMFRVTNNPKEVRIQMYLLDFMMRIKNMEKFAHITDPPSDF